MDGMDKFLINFRPNDNFIATQLTIGDIMIMQGECWRHWHLFDPYRSFRGSRLITEVAN